MTREGAFRFQHIYHALEGHLGMGVSLEGKSPHAAKQLNKTRLPRDIRTQHQGVDEKPHQVV